MTKKKKSIRLPNEIFPTHYNLTLKPDLESSTFSGKETIKIKIEKETNRIILHSKNLDIETIKITQYKKEEYSTKIKYDIKNETAIFYFKNKIKKGRATLSIVFSGIINESLRGFYKSKYEIDGKTKYLATTQFEATDARRAFPCFDEPAHKAIFNVSLIIPKNHTAISNTLPINIAEHEAGYKIVSFSSSPKMSTYLLAFITGEFECLEKKVNLSSKNILVRVFTTIGKKHQAKFALETAIKSVKFYNDYFDIPYPLPTLDLIAIPDFESAAMENWGAITFRESAVLVDEEHTSLSNKQWVAIVIAHELAHQWFGNLVTMRWWTDLWLNEGFASYMENFCINSLFPNWHIWDLNLTGRYDLALRLDSLKNSHPIEITVHHPEEINEIFDMVSYAKGSAIISMLAEYLGEEKFRDGLRFYLKKHSYRNTDTINLWQAFEKVSKKPIQKIMNSWTKQTGYPLLDVRPLAHASDIWEIEQKRFFSSRISRKNAEKVLWQIPISIEDKKILLTEQKTKINEDIKNKLNKNEKTFCRIKYSKEILEILKEKILQGKLPARDRLGIIRDLFALAEGGYIKTSQALDFSLAYKNETEYIVWSEIASGINRIYNLFSQEPFRKQYENYVLKLFSPLAQKMKWIKTKDEKHSETFLRSLAVSQAGFYGDKKIIKEAQDLFYKKKGNKIEPDLRSAIYGIVARNGGLKEWQNFEKMYKDEKMHEEKERCGYALSRFKDENLLKKTLELALSDNVRNQDAPQIISYVWQNENGRNLTWKFIKNNWPIILKNYGEGGHFLSRLLSPLGYHSKITDLKDAQKFFSKNTAPGSNRTLEQAYEKIESNIAWTKEDKKDIQNWFNKNL